MPLHPIAVVDQVIAEYRSYLETEFRARDEGLRAALEEALAQPRFLAQDPFFQAYRPFKEGLPWTDLGLDARLAKAIESRTKTKAAFLHQSEAIRQLLSPTASPLVVTTGTGSGKTECFLLPVIQNAIEDSTRFKRSGITAILVYPMNALANDQEERIRDYLEASGHTHVRVARYDRATKEDERQSLRKNPPHILLTNYLMLEYLLVRPADRDDLYANHRCRFIVLDEVHTYRGSLGANIALLFRRLLAHLRHARQDWGAEDRTDVRRFPSVVPVATSATIKSVDEQGRSPEEVVRLRDEAVQGFLETLTGFEGKSFKVIGEAFRDLSVPDEAAWPAEPVDLKPPDPKDADAVAKALGALAGMTRGGQVEEAARRAAILWKLNDLLARRPLSTEGIVERIRAEVPERREAKPEAVRREVETALVVGAALPDGTPGALRLRTHRFIRGGWKFYRCVDPACGKLYPMGEEQCQCGKLTGPLYVCRSCGADVLRFRDQGDPTTAPLVPEAGPAGDNEWLLYLRGDGEDGEDEDEFVGTEKQMRRRAVRRGSFDPGTCAFAEDEHAYPVKVVLAPARTRCLVCGATGGGYSALTPVALGTSAAVRVMAEGLVEGLAAQHRETPGHDGKERLLIFADSRQDAAHQARFITYAGRYDRMRRRLVRVLEKRRSPLTIEDAVRELMVLGVERRDNPRTAKYDDPDYLPAQVQANAKAWEEAPLLDDLSLSAGYRATVLNLGLVGVRYQHLERYVSESGDALAAKLGIPPAALVHLSRCLLDEMRRHGALSRPLLTYHPASPNCPGEFQAAADWERRLKAPTGYPCTSEGAPRPYIDRSEVPDGIKAQNLWRRPKGGGRGPAVEREFRSLLTRLGGVEPTEERLLEVLAFLGGKPRLLIPNKLHGFRMTMALLQVNADAIQLVLVSPEERCRCSVCHVRMPWAPRGAPCPSCHGAFVPWSESELSANRYFQRIRQAGLLPLVAGEHTAQITAEQRIELEEAFKGGVDRSPINVLSCSPTLEMGIDVGGLDAVVMRNVPPRPDNYAQRGGRAGRRNRVGIVLGYARSTPHDGYFYDKPEEMIAGEVPVPSVGLGNRDVVLRHLHAMALGGATPGLSGRMGTYLNLQGGLQEEAVEELISSVKEQFPRAVGLALEAWGPGVLGPAGLGTAEALRAELDRLPDRIRDLFVRVQLQIRKLDEAIETWKASGKGDWSATHAMELKRRLLGMRGDKGGADAEADDRTQGHPMRRFAEFGILPGYEFPSEPCTLRLLGDDHEEEMLSVERRFGIGQYQPEARVHARGHRWRVIGLDLSSPWNPKTPDPGWIYCVCKRCGLRYGAQEHVQCPRCKCDETLGRDFPAYEFGGFIATRDDTPVLEDEERYATANLVEPHPQWNGDIVARYAAATSWALELRRSEEIRWLNEWRRPSDSERKANAPCLHEKARGFYICPQCGATLSVPENASRGSGTKGRKRATKSAEADPYGHRRECARLSQEPKPHGIVTGGLASTLRVIVALPLDMPRRDYERWGYSLGYALRTGMRHLYMLDGPEVEFVLEPAWEARHEGKRLLMGSLTFLDPAVGGSGFLDRAAGELHLVARRALDHLDHPGCQSACYRCLKSYNNQRHHEHLSWPEIVLDLEQLASAPPEARPEKTGDREEVKAWLEAYEAGVGSPLELKFLRLFEKHGVEVEKQVPVAANDGERPISIADFVLKGTRVAIYVDGAAFHRGDRLRRDRFIRDRLRAGNNGWRVVELGARDLGRGAAIVETVRGETRPR